MSAQRISGALIGCSLLSVAMAQVPSPPLESAAFSIRVDPSVAGAVNSVLAHYAENVVTDIKAGEDVATFLQQRCGGAVAPVIADITILTNGKQRVSHTACARVGGSRTVTVEPGLTLEGIAARWGLRPDKVSRMKIRAGSGNPNRSSIRPTALLPGDEVLIPQTSLWTEIRLKRGESIGRDGLLSAIADALGCTDEECVRRMGVLLLQQGSPVEKPPRATTEEDASMIEYSSDREWLVSDVSATLSHPRETDSFVAWAYVSASATFDISPPALSPVPPPPPATADVASDQWPYDAIRVASVLRKDRDLLRIVTLGVADGGLRAPAGDPLPLDILARNSGEIDGGEVDDDDDQNLYVDDFYGAGLRRSDDATLATDMLGTGNLDLCPSQPDFATWSPQAQLLASHGSVVSSIAAGWPLRNGDPPLKLPHIQFYRMVTEQCGPDSTFKVQDGDINKALRYLFGQKAEVVNLSYKIAIRGSNADLKAAAAAELSGDTRMLVVAAGNDDPDDLDEGNLCPACLGSPLAENLSRRVLVIGSAERSLKASPGSNVGEKTVRLYAPGQAKGIDILGQPVADKESATSYAAPLAALATAILKAYGIQNYWEVTERLDAASWPLLTRDGNPDPTARVIDLTRVVAVFQDAIEATAIEDGVNVRRTYVGKIVGRIQDIGICQSTTFKRGTVHAIRLGPVKADGTRYAQSEERGKGDKYFPQRQFRSCRSSGTIAIDDVLGQRVEIPLDRVNQILLYWQIPPT